MTPVAIGDIQRTQGTRKTCIMPKNRYRHLLLCLHNFPQDFPATISRKIFPSWILIGWLPITLFQMLNFHQSMPFLNWLFPLLHFPQEFPARFSRKNFPQQFPARFSRNNLPQDFPELDPDWLAPHHPIPNAKFPPITGLLNRPTYHKRSKVSPPPFPQILWEPQINEYADSNEPAMM